MGLESTLNLLWLSLGAAGLGLLLSSEVRDRRRCRCRARLGRGLAVVLAVVFLFPCVSASDDLLSVQGLLFTLETRGEAGNGLPHRTSNDEKAELHLARLFETLQSVQVARAFSLSLTLEFFAQIYQPHSRPAHRYLVSPEGRAPPRYLPS